MNLAALEKQRLDLQGQIKTETDRHEAQMRDLKASFAETCRLIAVSAAGLDTDLIAQAEAVLEVRGSYAKAGEDRAYALQQAIDDLATGGNKIKRQYFGTKDYAHWHGQYIDCSYGCGPAHGHVIFSIGVRRSEVGRQLNEGEINACLYYLRNLVRIQDAAAKAAA